MICALTLGLYGQVLTDLGIMWPTAHSFALENIVMHWLISAAGATGSLILGMCGQLLTASPLRVSQCIGRQPLLVPQFTYAAPAQFHAQSMIILRCSPVLANDVGWQRYRRYNLQHDAAMEPQVVPTLSAGAKRNRTVVRSSREVEQVTYARFQGEQLLRIGGPLQQYGVARF